MNHYIEIRVLPDPEFNANVLLNALYAKLHRALSDAGQGEIGASFPNAGKILGDCIRLHGSQGALQRLMGLGWLKGLSDYTRVSEIELVPDKCQYRIVRRVQAKSSVERLYRRSVKNGRLTAEEAEAKINAGKDQLLKHPFIQLKSRSSGQTFRLFIQQGKLSGSPQAGKYSDYGLSDSATIPWF